MSRRELLHILHSAMEKDFFQEGPSLGNQFREDLLLLHYLQYRMPGEVYSKLEPELDSLGAEAESLLELARKAEEEEPQHKSFEPWGRRVDNIVLSSAWRALEKFAIERGLLATGYERKSEQYSRIHQFALLYLFHPSSAFVTCPLAMSDGVAKLLEHHGGEDFKEAFNHLTTRDGKDFWLSGQWMTERAGGSDLGRTETQALCLGKNDYTLHGPKWFCSAIHTQLSVALARIKGDPEGSHGLSAFLIQVRDSKNVLNPGIQIQRLKDKLGTRALPTAEVVLDGVKAKCLGERGSGIRVISTVFNISRIYNSICAISTMRRALAYVKSYAKKREAFGKPISQHLLYKKTLDTLDLEFHASFLLSFHVVYLFGKEDVGKASEEEKGLLRLLIPIVKLYTGRKAPVLVSEAMELIGGAAYMEDTDFPRLFRDAQVFPIWEGTTNILSLDMLRAIKKENGAFEVFCRDIKQRLETLPASVEKELLENSLKLLVSTMGSYKDKDSSFLEEKARTMAFLMGDLYSASLLLEFSHWCKSKKVYPELASLIKKISQWTNWKPFQND